MSSAGGRRPPGTVLLLIGSVIFGALLGGCRAEPERLGLGSRLSFELPTLDGRRLGPSDYRGRVVILDFMATWCAPCKVQNDVLSTLGTEYSEDRLQILVVDSGEPMERVRKHFEERPIHHPVLVDADAALTDRLDIMGFPTLLILDEGGAVVFAREGLSPPKVLREELEKLGLTAISPEASS